MEAAEPETRQGCIRSTLFQTIACTEVIPWKSRKRPQSLEVEKESQARGFENKEKPPSCKLLSILGEERFPFEWAWNKLQSCRIWRIFYHTSTTLDRSKNRMCLIQPSWEKHRNRSKSLHGIGLRVVMFFKYKAERELVLKTCSKVDFRIFS